jgi:hypothetical protein
MYGSGWRPITVINPSIELLSQGHSRCSQPHTR